jgi:hypothetical protein
MKKIIKALALVTLLTTTGCTQADTVRHNITENADSFNVTRRITVFNTRTDKAKETEEYRKAREEERELCKKCFDMDIGEQE